MDRTNWVSQSSYWASHWESLDQCWTGHLITTSGRSTHTLHSARKYLDKYSPNCLSSLWFLIVLVTDLCERVRWRMRYDLMMKLERAGLHYLTTCLRLRGMLAGCLSLSPTCTCSHHRHQYNNNTSRERERDTCLLTQAYLTPALQCLAFSLNMRGLCLCVSRLCGHSIQFRPALCHPLLSSW